MDYTDAVTTGVLSPHVLPIEDLREMLSHIEETLPSTMHLPISSEDALHFYRYLCTLILIANEQFLILIKVPIQDHAQQLEIYECLIWLYLTEISQHTSAYKTDTWAKYQKINSNMPEGQQAILQFKCTASTTHQQRTVSRKDVHYRSGKLAL